MSWEPYIGRKVVCVRDDWVRMSPGEQGPCVGGVYTIRSAECGWSSPDLFLRFFELVNPNLPRVELCGEKCECNFIVGAFKPLDERPTDISVFVAMLDPAHEASARNRG